MKNQIFRNLERIGERQRRKEINLRFDINVSMKKERNREENSKEKH